MLNLFKNIFGKKKVKVFMHLDEDTIKNNEIIKAQQQKIQSQEAQISLIYAKEKEKKDKEKEKDKDKESEFNKKLIEQEKDLKANKYGKIVDLGKFYKHYFSDKKFRDKLEICDKNDEIVLAKFGGFGIMTGGKLCIKDNKGEIMAYGKTLNQILSKPDAFENMARRGRFLIPVDRDGNWLEDIEYKEIQEPLDAEFDEETGKIKRIIWSKVKTSEVKKIIGEKMEQINYLHDELESRDSVVIKLKSQIDDLKRSMKIYEAQGNISQSELSKSLSNFIETEKRLGDLHTQITKLTELKAIHEKLIDAKDHIIDKVISKLDNYSDPKSELIKEDIYSDLERAKGLLPEKVEIKQESPPEPRPTTQPGDIIKR